MSEIQTQPSNGKAITSLALGILSIFLSVFWPIAFVLGVLAIIFGAISLSRIKKGEASGIGLSRAGIITGSIGVFLAIVFVIVTIIALPAANTDTRDLSRQKDVNALSVQVTELRNGNDERTFPEASDLDTSELLIVKTVASTGEPTTTTAVYKTGVTCDGTEFKQASSIRVLLESGKEYCI